MTGPDGDAPGETPRSPRRRPAAKGAPKKARKKRSTGTTRTKKSPAAPPAPRKSGRPPKTPTPEQIAQVERMAQLGLNDREMALLLDMHRETFAKYKPGYFDTAIAKGAARGKMASGLVLFREMQAGNMTALIWYEKTRHGMTEKTHTIVSDPNGDPLPPAQLPPTVAIFLPPNGRDIPAPGQEIPAQFHIHPTSEARLPHAPDHHRDP
ncbi:hypothetical protein [Gemmatimonas sp.]